MTRSLASPKPVRIGRYRYSKLRWRVLVHAFDFLGILLVSIVRRFIRPRPIGRPERILLVQLDHLGDAVLEHALDRRAAGCLPGGDDRRAGLAEQSRSVRGRPSRKSRLGGRADLVRTAP